MSQHGPPREPVVAIADAEAAPQPAAKPGLLAHGFSQELQIKKAKCSGGGGGGSAADAETTCGTAAERVAARSAASKRKTAAQMAQATKDGKKTYQPYMQWEGKGTQRSDKTHTKRHWLRFTSDMSGAHCLACIASGLSGAFCSEEGARSHTDGTLIVHENSPAHKVAVRSWLIATQELDSVQIADILIYLKQIF